MNPKLIAAAKARVRVNSSTSIEDELENISNPEVRRLASEFSQVTGCKVTNANTDGIEDPEGGLSGVFLDIQGPAYLPAFSYSYGFISSEQLEKLTSFFKKAEAIDGIEVCVFPNEHLLTVSISKATD